MIIPTVTDARSVHYDIYSYLLKDRIIILADEISRNVAEVVIASLIYLDHQETDTISLYINSPGGTVTDGLAIIDTMNHVKSDVSTVCIGDASSMGAMILTSGANGKRFALPHARVMIHQPSGGFGGTATDVEIGMKELLRVRDVLVNILSTTTGQTKKRISKDMDRDFYMTAMEAKKYGIIDEVLE